MILNKVVFENKHKINLDFNEKIKKPIRNQHIIFIIYTINMNVLWHFVRVYRKIPKIFNSKTNTEIFLSSKNINNVIKYFPN